MDSYQELIEETRARVGGALAALLEGAGPDEAVLGSGMLALFDDGDEIDGMAPLERLAHAGAEDWEAERTRAVFESLSGILACCAYWHPADGGEAVTYELVTRYHELATLVPVAVWRHRLMLSLRRLNRRTHGALELAEAKERAVERLGGQGAVMDAVRAWEPDAEERTRLQRLLVDGHEVDALVQALEQAVFSAQLDEFF